MSFSSLIAPFKSMLKELLESPTLPIKDTFGSEKGHGVVFTRNILLSKGLVTEKNIADSGNGDFRGLYCIYLDEKPIYVGISKRHIHRVRDHFKGTNHQTSSFAYRLAKQKYLEANNDDFTNPKTKKDYTREQFYDLGLVAKARKEVERMEIRFLPVSDPTQLYLFEVYCALELNTPMNSFDTH